MSLNGNDTYLILNYNPSAVSVSTRDTSYLIPGGSQDAPASFPLTLNEIRYINNVSKAFKYGLLFFEHDVEDEMYAELHIPDWRNIMRDEEIESIIADPTVDGLERILNISDQLYFERVYGVYVGMKNAGIPISAKVEGLLVTRRKELARGKVSTDLSVRQVKPSGASDEKIKALEEQVAKLTAMLTSQNTTTEESQKDSPAPKKTTEPKDQVVSQDKPSERATSKPAPKSSKPRQSKTAKGG